ncbi:MAG: hypothetical protein ABI639_04890 [Thermoanaerobaculia bacterium]
MSSSAFQAAPAGGRTVLALAFFVLAATVCATYTPILDNGWVWDDGTNLIAARANWDRGWSGIVWAFETPVAGHYQPLTWLSYGIDARLSAATPRGVHATNLLLHLIATAFVAALGWTLSGGGPRAAIASDFRRRALASLLSAAIFALHPIRVETVAWATERRDLLSSVFVLAALLLHLRTAPADDSPSSRRGSIALLHALAALARAQMTLPFVLLVLDLWPLQRLQEPGGRWRSLWRLATEKALSFAIAGASAGAALWAQASSGALTGLAEHGLVDRFVQAGYGLSFYPSALVGRTAWLPLHERPFPFDPAAPALLVPALLALAALVACAMTARRWPAIAAAVASYLLLVLPVLGFAQSGIQLVAERYAYLSTVPFVLLAAVALTKLDTTSIPRIWRLLSAAGLLLWLCGLALASHRQALVWRDDESVWRHVLAHSRSCLAENNLGQILAARGETGPALLHLVRSLEVVPVYSRPWRALVALLEAPPPLDAPPPPWVALTLERAALAQPGSPIGLHASGLAWWRAGHRDRALLRLNRLIALEPRNEGARRARAWISSRFPTASISPAAPAVP